MKLALVFPSRESEKAISGYSVNLVNGLKKNKVDVKAETYTAGSPSSFFKKISKLKNYDIIHIQHEYNLLGYYGLPFFLIFTFLWFKNKRIVTTMHTVLSQKQKFKGNFIKNFFRKLLYFFQNRLINLVSDYIIVHADFHKEILVEEYGVQKTKIKVFFAGVPEKIKITHKQKAKKELELSGPIYLIIGNLVPDHGADIIIKQAKKIGKTILVVANPKSINDRKQKRLTNYLNSNIKYVKENNLESVVRFDIWDITDENPIWWKYFSATDLILQAYKGDILSGIFMHAMAAKKPVIASNIKFFREISKNFGCVKMIKKEEDYAKVIREAMKPKNYNKMVKECDRYLKENSWTVISGKYKDLYNKIIKLS